MTPDELYVHLLLVPDSTQEIIRLIGTIDYARALAEYMPDAAWRATRTAPRGTARDAAWGAAYGAAYSIAWDATRGAAYSATRNATWGATRDAAQEATRDATREATRAAAQDATLLAGAMVVRDILEKAHRDVALSHFCWWLQFKKEK